jgi:hypothetical protein
MPYYISPPPQNPITRIITAIVAVLALVGSLMLGMAALLVVAGVGLIAGIALWLRIAWIKRRLQKEGIDLGAATKPPPQSGHVIDAEYTVVSDSRDEQDR